LIPEETNPAACSLRILLIEDNPADAELEIAELRRGGFEVVADRAETRSAVSSQLERSSYDLVLADYNLPHFRGMEALEVLQEKGLSTPLILVTGALKSVTAVECLKQGATDYVLKDNLSRLPLCVRRALEESRMKLDRKKAEDARWPTRWRNWRAQTAISNNLPISPLTTFKNHCGWLPPIPNFSPTVIAGSWTTRQINILAMRLKARFGCRLLLKTC